MGQWSLLCTYACKVIVNLLMDGLHNLCYSADICIRLHLCSL